MAKKYYKFFVMSLFSISLASTFIDHRYGYIPLVILSLIGLARFSVVISSFYLIDFLPLFVFITWAIVCVHGIILNGLSNSLENFPSMPLYLAYYSLYRSNISRYEILSILNIMSIVAFIYGAYLLVDSLASGSFLKGVYSSLSDFRIEYAPFTIYLLFPIFSYIYSFILCKSNKAVNIKNKISHIIPSGFVGLIYVLISIGIFIFVSMSKAFILSIALFFILSLFVGLFNRSGNLPNTYFLIFLSVMILFIVLYNFCDIIEFSYSGDEISNSTRDEQLPKLLNEISFFGAGFGTVLSSGYVRDWSFPASFELTYINLIHKMGLFSLPIFFIWTYIFYKNLKIIFLGSDFYSVWASGILLALHAYLFIGYSNPIAFATNFISINILTIYFFRPTTSNV